MVREIDHGRGSGAAASGDGAGQNGYQLSLLLQLPAEKGQSPFSFVCSSSGSTASSPDGGHGSREVGAGGLDRVCALRGAVVYILTFIHESDGAVGDGAGMLIQHQGFQCARYTVQLLHRDSTVPGRRLWLMTSLITFSFLNVVYLRVGWDLNGTMLRRTLKQTRD